MKNSVRISGLIFFAGIFLLLLQSCSGNFRIEKRHYRNGYYFSSAGNKTEETVITNSIQKQKNLSTDLLQHPSVQKEKSLIQPEFSGITKKEDDVLKEKRPTKKIAIAKQKIVPFFTKPVFKNKTAKFKQRDGIGSNYLVFSSWAFVLTFFILFIVGAHLVFALLIAAVVAFLIAPFLIIIFLFNERIIPKRLYKN
jgi:Flp pilus assembly protein TadB